ncbi:hypothetical protein EBESD8_55470 [Rhodococcus aetherivorans]|nr:hypothetical protein EBESD8_55470 [Rhodococcus aetherivorans]
MPVRQCVMVPVRQCVMVPVRQCVMVPVRQCAAQSTTRGARTTGREDRR